MPAFRGLLGRMKHEPCQRMMRSQQGIGGRVAGSIVGWPGGGCAAAARYGCAAGAAEAPPRIMIATRRLALRPAGESLACTGWYSP